MANTSLRLGIQMCREIRYPEQWRARRPKARKSSPIQTTPSAAKRRRPLARALHQPRRETQRFILGANNAAPDQTCPTMIVAPSGAISPKLQSTRKQLRYGNANSTTFQLGLISARDDVVVVTVLDPSARPTAKAWPLSKQLTAPLTGRPTTPSRISLSDREMVSVLDAPFGCL
ncbi:MAG: hypothetical protein IPL62_19785 [Caulobacteraceae bacterium]|nr:hypothetical protein [Caulobacteraceae bacterium]